ncbi:hypothetical protein [Amycolatopsis ultiminotia]|uniref:hypothetical protein n=1 Tax=Amycolatopsis ultiminotia TaxID=543629 RepID=UPI0031EBF985
MTLTSPDGRAVLVRRDDNGPVSLTDRLRFAVPLTLRARCSLRSGDPVLLAANPHRDVLVIYTMPFVDQLLVSAHETMMSGEQP